MVEKQNQANFLRATAMTSTEFRAQAHGPFLTRAEALRPPLTFLEPTGNYQVETIGSTRLTVIEVVPI